MGCRAREEETKEEEICYIKLILRQLTGNCYGHGTRVTYCPRLIMLVQSGALSSSYISVSLNDVGRLVLFVGMIFQHNTM